MRKGHSRAVQGALDVCATASAVETQALRFTRNVTESDIWLLLGLTAERGAETAPFGADAETTHSAIPRDGSLQALDLVW